MRKPSSIKLFNSFFCLCILKVTCGGYLFILLSLCLSLSLSLSLSLPLSLYPPPPPTQFSSICMLNSLPPSLSLSPPPPAKFHPSVCLTLLLFRFLSSCSNFSFTPFLLFHSLYVKHHFTSNLFALFIFPSALCCLSASLSLCLSVYAIITLICYSLVKRWFKACMLQKLESITLVASTW